MAKTTPLSPLKVHAPDPSDASAAPTARQDEKHQLFAKLLRRPGRAGLAHTGAVQKVYAPLFKVAVAPATPPQEAAVSAAPTALQGESAVPVDPEAGSDSQEGSASPEDDQQGRSGHGDGDSPAQCERDAELEGADTGVALDELAAQMPSGPGAQAAAAAGAANTALRVDARDRAVVDYLAATVTGFCNAPGVRGGDGWRVHIDLNPDILPATRLHLQLSPHWLLLRFECADMRAKALVCSHQSSLAHALEDSLSPRRDVSIDID